MCSERWIHISSVCVYVVRTVYVYVPVRYRQCLYKWYARIDICRRTDISYRDSLYGYYTYRMDRIFAFSYTRTYRPHVHTYTDTSTHTRIPYYMHYTQAIPTVCIVHRQYLLCSPHSRDSLLCSPHSRDSLLCSPHGRDSAVLQYYTIDPRCTWTGSQFHASQRFHPLPGCPSTTGIPYYS